MPSLWWGLRIPNHSTSPRIYTICIHQPINTLPYGWSQEHQPPHPHIDAPYVYTRPQMPSWAWGPRTPNTPRPSPYLRQLLLIVMGFPCGSAGKESACSVGDLGCIPGWGRSPWRRERPPTPVFWPGKSHGKRSLVRDRCSGYKDSDKTKWLTLDFTLLEVLPWRLKTVKNLPAI